MKKTLFIVCTLLLGLNFSAQAVNMDGTLVSAEETSIKIKNNKGEEVTFTTDKKSPYILIKYITLDEVPSGSPVSYRGKADLEKNEVNVNKIIFKDPASKNFKTSVKNWGGSAYLQRDGETLKLEVEDKILNVKSDPQKGIEVILQTDGKKFDDVKKGTKVRVEHPKKEDFSRIYRVYYYENNKNDVKTPKISQKSSAKSKPEKKTETKPKGAPRKAETPKGVPEISIKPINTGHKTLD